MHPPSRSPDKRNMIPRAAMAGLYQRHAILCCGQPLLTTGCGYLPIGALPTGYLPIGALPTGAAGGGGSLRGRSAAAAALSMAKDAAVTVRIFSMTNPLVFGQHLCGNPG